MLAKLREEQWGKRAKQRKHKYTKDKKKNNLNNKFIKSHDYFAGLYTNKFENPEEISTFLEKYRLPKLSKLKI